MSKVALVMGSKSDSQSVQPCIEILKSFNIDCMVYVISAHRTPENAREFGKQAESMGIEVIIAAAGYAAHLPGVLASWTTLPVIGIPLASSDLKGIDSLYSIVQMPAGIPVATVSVGTAGAKNAAYLAVEILGLKYPELKAALENYRRQLAGS
jgi:5-(carboxyamino)imidazole ribonucleotide mutase